ncbi:rhodanese-related sulfurtransferase [Salegentibacter sp. 24]|uniref:rhodanese-like domain-containing protein n=1 Tax=Salegentibacter sp. 24 TaxID=2183986 RepID=UPI00105C9038|nr:rhodanese-like domain-containing protein [Salegentibacter sp. 24]TDN93402.1 rhodanese-related sulfurtransferase [Salegentibacter sp. 24]
MKNLTKEEWKKQLAETSQPQIIDVRTKEEFAAGHLKNARQLDIMQQQGFMEAIKDLDKNKNYYVYCRSGNRSSQACRIMEAHGVNSTYNLIGGLLEWDGEIVK